MKIIITYYSNTGMKCSAEHSQMCFTLRLGHKRTVLLGNPGTSDFMCIYIYCKYTQYVQYEINLSVDVRMSS